MEITPDENTLLIPIATDIKKRPALSSTSSSLTHDPPPSKSPAQDNITQETPSKPNTSKISQPTTKKLKRNQCIQNIALKLDEILGPAKPFEEMPNKKINYEQFKFIIENSLGVSNPASVLDYFDITCL